MFILTDRTIYKKELANNTENLARMLVDHSRAALLSADRNNAGKCLSVLRTQRNIIAAAIYNQQGALFVKYQRQGSEEIIPFRPGNKQLKFTSLYCMVTLPVNAGNEQIGSIYIKSDLESLNSRFNRYFIMILLTVLLVTLIAFLIVIKLQKIVTAPLLNLVEIVKQISDGNYQPRF